MEDRKENGTRRIVREYDYTLLFLTILLVCFGLVMVYSTSYYNAQYYYGNATLYFNQQLESAIVGLVAMLALSFISYRLFLKRLGPLPIKLVTAAYLVCVVLQIYTSFFSEPIQGSRRWIAIGGFTFQTSELSKLCIILFFAYVAQTSKKRLNTFPRFLVVLLYAVPMIGPVIKENLSSALIMIIILFVICFVASRKKWYFILVGVVTVAIVLIFIFAVGYRNERINIWLDIENHPDGYQILQGLYAIASGGLFGRGFGQSIQKRGYIPEAHTDIIFTVICEELGLVGAIALILVFVILLWRLFKIACCAADLFGSLIATGVLAQIASQMILNIAVVTNSIPATGIPLPFISHGGSSLVVLMAEIGICLNVSSKSHTTETQTVQERRIRPVENDMAPDA